MDEGLTEEQVLECLCYRDSRNPSSIGRYDDSPEVLEPRKDCYCDPCFTGKDRLAIEILRLRALLESTRA